MPTRWMRWNETTHVFENSVDGVSFTSLPLNASCLEGTIPPGTLPGGGGGASATGDNTWTGTNTYSGVAPVLRFNETDGAANQKNWEIGADTALFRVRTLNDALAAPATLFTIDRNGNLSVSAVTVGTHNFNASVDGANYLHVINTSAGVSAVAGMMIQNNVGDARGFVLFTSSGNTNAAFAPDALSLHSVGAGGVSINASVGPINIKTANTARITVAASGAVTIPGALNVTGAVDFDGPLTAAAITSVGTLSVTGAIVASTNVNAGTYCYSYGNPIGGFANVAWAAAYFSAANGVWTVEAADMVTFAWTIIGKTMTVLFEFVNTSVSAATAELRLTLPVGAIPNRTTTGSGWSEGFNATAGYWANLILTATAGVAYLSIKPVAPSTGTGANFAASANLTDVRGQITFPIN